MKYRKVNFFIVGRLEELPTSPLLPRGKKEGKEKRVSTNVIKLSIKSFIMIYLVYLKDKKRMAKMKAEPYYPISKYLMFRKNKVFINFS